MPNERRICKDIQEGAYTKKKGDCRWPVCRSQVEVRNVLLDSKIKQARLRGRQVLGIFCFSWLRFEISRLRLRFLSDWDLLMMTDLIVTLRPYKLRSVVKRASWRTGRLTQSVRLRPGYTKHSMSLYKPVCRDLKLPQFPLSKIGTYPSSGRVKFENFDLLPSRVFTKFSVNINIF